jgi:hypothetical protein
LSASSEMVWRSSLQTLTCCCFWSAVRNHMRPDTRLQIKGSKKPVPPPTCVKFCTLTPKTCQYYHQQLCCATTTVVKKQQQTRKLWISPHTFGKSENIYKKNSAHI